MPGGGSEQGCWQGFVPQHRSLPPSCCSQALAAVIPCSGLKISPGAAAAHRHLEVVINNLEGGGPGAGPASLRPFLVRAPVPTVMLQGWMDRWRHVGKWGQSSLCPLAKWGN